MGREPCRLPVRGGGGPAEPGEEIRAQGPGRGVVREPVPGQAVKVGQGRRRSGDRRQGGATAEVGAQGGMADDQGIVQGEHRRIRHRQPEHPVPVRGLDGGLDLIAARITEGVGPAEDVVGHRHGISVPAFRVLIRQRHECPRRGGPRVAPGVDQEQQREQAQGFRVGRRRVGGDPGEPHRVVRQGPPSSSSPAVKAA